ncbi:AAA family ATPase [Herbiconiux sp. VKM Ac-1786]|uniref:AAA family ATPase n=1 Tax=Herbiconiux sp. VKM Ac-1786 TaxID=2783824 RepID=UPI00188C19F3|nr:AAA family ATPase [Herbiconiux sp. VKM Ac-1786]
MLADGRQARRLGLDALSGMGAGRYHAAIRGREAETRQIEHGFDVAAAGDQAVTFISGDPGIGKTRLLQHALHIAADRNWTTMVVAPDIDSALSPLGALIGAATRTDPPLVTNDDLGPLMLSPAPKYWLTRMIAESLESQASKSGALVIVDDLQWLDAGSLGAITALIHDLQGVPVYWLLASRTGVYSAAHQRFLARIGELTPTIDLPPLDKIAVDDMVRDAFGSQPGPRVEQALTRAAGYPLLVLELLRGLEEEGLLQSARGVIDLDDDTLPARFGTSARDRLSHLSRDALRIAQIGSLYGRDFPLSGVLDILGQTAAAAAPALQELLDLGFVVDTSTSFAFRHDTVQAAASESLSPSLRRAMTREVIHRRLRAGEGVATLASAIVSVAEAGDDESIELLFLAAQQLSSTDVQGAAELVITGAQLTSGNAAHADRVAAMLPLVLAGGRIEEAMEMSRTLRPLLSPDARARVSLALARQLTESDFDGALRESAAGLAIPGISDESRVGLLSVRALNFANKADEQGLRTSLALAREASDDGRDGLALATLDATESVLVFYQGDFDTAERLQRQALDRVTHLGIPTGLWLPEGLWLAFMRNSTGHCDEALRLTDDGLAEVRAAKNVLAEAYWMMVRSRVLYSLGRLDDARAQAETVLELGEQLGLGDFMNATAGVVLHRISLRTGDVPLRERVRPLIQSLADSVGLTRTGRWSLAMEAQERMKPDEAYEYSRLAIATLRDATPSMTTPADFADDFVLAFICQVAGDLDAVDVVVEVAQDRADKNSTNVFVAAVARAARGIRDRSANDLLAAAEQLRDECRPLVTGTLFEAVGIYSATPKQATTALTDALHFYTRCGATRDATRVLQMLRSKGVHQRPISPTDARDATGLSPRERQVAAFISSGLTTQQIADELLVSPHTVVTYIRHIYAKWGLNTRREVAERYAELGPI